MYSPDKWFIVKIETQKDTFYKVFGSWSGGYLTEDSWRMNSGITKVRKTGSTFHFHGSSGSVYVCDKDAYGSTTYGNSVITSMLSKFPNSLSILSEDEWEQELKKLSS